MNRDKQIQRYISKLLSIRSLSNNLYVSNPREKNPYKHYAVLFSGDLHFIGENSYRKAGRASSLHAETDVIRKLLRDPRMCNSGGRNRRIYFDLLIIRITKTGYISNSLPCVNCMKHLCNLHYNTKFKIRNIYYSTDERTIVCLKFSEFNTNFVSRGFAKIIKNEKII